jgi:hypothetical protein
MVAMVGMGVAGCGNTGDIGAVRIDSDAGDDSAVDEPEGVIIADLPQTDFARPATAIITDAGNNQDTQPDGSDTYELEPNSITTCGQFFECIQECRVAHDSCMGPCNEAMTNEASTTVHRFMNCVSQNGCRSGGCITQYCGQEAEACFRSPY